MQPPLRSAAIAIRDMAMMGRAARQGMNRQTRIERSHASDEARSR